MRKLGLAKRERERERKKIEREIRELSYLEPIKDKAWFGQVWLAKKRRETEEKRRTQGLVV